MNNVFVYCELEGTTVADVSLELLTKGRKLANQLGCQLEAIIAGTNLNGVESQVLPYGVDKVHVFDAPGLFPYTTLPHASILINLFKEEKPQICLMGATVIGRDLGPRVSSALTSGLTADCTSLEIGSHEDKKAGKTYEELMEKTNEFLAAASKSPVLSGVRTTFSTATPQYRIDLDREKTRLMNIPINSVYTVMQSTFGSLYVNDFTYFGRNFRVTMQSEADFRRSPDDLHYVYVKSNTGALVPLDSLISVERVAGPELINRFNIFPAAKVLGDPAPGYSSGQAIAEMEKIADEVLGTDYSLSWIGSAYQEKLAGGASTQAFIFGLIMVFLILSAQYEKWSLPFVVLLSVPFAILGALLATWARGLSNDLYFQVGLVTLIGLAAKNAILIVEFAVIKAEEGLSYAEAAVEAARLRFRPIVMTSLAFTFGVLPLALSTGAGSGSRHAIGTGMVGGMIFSTFIATIFVPMMYAIISETFDKKKKVVA